MTKLNISVAQMQVSDDIKSNLAKVKSYVKEAKRLNSAILCLPEGFYHMGKSNEDKVAILEPYGRGLVQDTVKELAAKYDIAILAGTMPIQSSKNSSKMFAKSIFFDRKGSIVSEYDKIHLFDANLSNGETFKESSFTQHGEKIVTFEYDNICFGLSVCYDIRFPELYIEQVKNGAQVLLISSAFAKSTGKYHWHALARSRAIENFCFVVATDQVGIQPSGKSAYGHSLIVNPWGEILLDMKDEEGVRNHILDMSEIKKAREQVPSLSHRSLI